MHPDMAVFLALLLIALILVSVSLLWAHWISPKLAELTTLQQQVGRIDGTLSQALTSNPADSLLRLETNLSAVQENVKSLQDGKYSEAVSNLSERIRGLEAEREGERKLQEEQNRNLREAVERLLEDLRQLQKRSEREIQRMLVDQKYALAVEQAGQDVDLAEIGEQLARLQPALHPAAVERLAKAKAGLEQLKQRGVLRPESTSNSDA
jgi:hypothetical protein